MKKLLSILFAAVIGLSLSMATFAQAQDAPKAETKKTDTKKTTHHHKTKATKAPKTTEKPAETK
jgi:hypothetical protein